MTLLTSLGLPYQVSADRACDAPGVWCSFTSIAETKLVAIDNIVNRISPSVPAAKIRRSTPLTVTAPLNVGIPFESTVYDTDNMVNLANAPAILPRRLGRYLLTMVAQNITTSWSNTNAVIQLNITSGALVTDPTGLSTAYNSVGFANSIAVVLGAGSVINDNWFKASVIADWSSTDSQGWGVQIGPTQTGILGICELSAHWVSDLHI